MEQRVSGNTFDNVKRAVAEKLEQAACSLGGQTEEGTVLGPYSRQASEWLHHSAEYVRDFDIKRADMELRNQIRSHPGRSMLVGLGAGILVGFFIRRR
jgi:hypothetical protein